MPYNRAINLITVIENAENPMGPSIVAAGHN
jgi:hypothetical protein